jgi:site-specific DNA-methyltransferase (adenine-specific)
MNGALWTEEIGDATLYLGNCLDILPHLGPVDAVVTDPPYGMNWNTDFTRFSAGNSRRGKGTKHRRVLNDDQAFDPSPFLAAGECVLFGCNHFWHLLPAGGCLVWIKRNDEALNSFLSDGELAFLKGRQGVYAYREVIAGSKKAVEAGLDPYGPSAHPTQKPIGLMVWAMSYVKSRTITDPFMGSGTTGVACAKLGRKFVGIEIDERYFEIACRRIEDAYKQPDMFIARPAAATQEALL